jgi:nuclear polyadenylated RNA-binding protein NAB2
VILVRENKISDVYSSHNICPERSFTDWLFVEAAKDERSEPTAPPETQPIPVAPSTSRDTHPQTDAARRNPPNGPRGGAPLYQQALNQATASTSPSGQKRAASARSPSPTGQGPNKSRRTDLPVGPRAMRDRDVRRNNNNPSGPRSLLDRVGPARPPQRPNNFPHDMPMMQGGPFPPNMNEMDMNAMAAAQMGGANPVVLQEMMMNQMALMAQMASSLGIINPGMMGYPMQGGMQDANMFNNNNNGGMNGFQGHQGQDGAGRGRGGQPSRGRGGRPPQSRTPAGDDQNAGSTSQEQSTSVGSNAALQVVAPSPQAPAPLAPGFAVPERPQSATLCKFGLKCTNVSCRWSHPSPVATPESGVVLSNEPCENGKNCKDKDCVKAHVSPAVANPALGTLALSFLSTLN